MCATEPFSYHLDGLADCGPRLDAGSWANCIGCPEEGCNTNGRPKPRTRYPRPIVSSCRSLSIAAAAVLAGEDGVVKIWDLSAPAQATRTIELQSKGVCSLAWLSNPTTAASEHGWLACGMGDNTIILCDPETGKEVK